jgi:hypothetical protein
MVRFKTIRNPDEASTASQGRNAPTGARTLPQPKESTVILRRARLSDTSYWWEGGGCSSCLHVKNEPIFAKEIPGHACRYKTDMGEAYQNQKKTAQPKSETNALATRKINTISTKQTTPIQSSTQTHMDLWNSAMH